MIMINLLIVVMINKYFYLDKKYIFNYLYTFYFNNIL